MPLYSLLVLAVVTLTVFESGFRVSVPRGQLLSELTNAFSMGARILGSINGSEAGTYAGTATWTLTYEWRFYVLLPLMAYLSTLKRNAGWLLIAPLVFLGVDSHQIGYQAPFYCALLLCGIISIWFRSNWWLMLIPFFFLGYDHMYLLFAFGMLSAHLSKVSRLVELLRSNTISLIVLLVVPLIWWTSIDPYSLATESLCFIAFLPIACGNSLFGILRITGLRTLGTISYSIYLIHCLVLYLLYRTFQLGPTFVGMNSIEFWISMAAVMVLVVIVSIVTFRYFELPFMIMGRKSERPEAS